MKKIFSVVSISLIIILLTDLLFGSYLLRFTPKKIDHIMDKVKLSPKLHSAGRID